MNYEVMEENMETPSASEITGGQTKKKANEANYEKVLKIKRQ